MSTIVRFPEVSARKPETLEEYLIQNGIKSLTEEEVSECKKQGEEALRNTLPVMQRMFWIFRPIIHFALPTMGPVLVALSGLGFSVGLLASVFCFGLAIWGFDVSEFAIVAKSAYMGIVVGWFCFFSITLLAKLSTLPLFAWWQEVDISLAWIQMPDGFPAEIWFLQHELSALPDTTLSVVILGNDPGLFARQGNRKACVAWWNGADVQIGSRL